MNSAQRKTAKTTGVNNTEHPAAGKQTEEVNGMDGIKMGLTIEEAAETTGIGRNTMRKLIDWGKLPVLKVGRKTIIRRDTLESFMTVNQGRNLRSQSEVRRVE